MNLENKKQIATILLAVGLGMVAVFLAKMFIDRERAEMATAVEQRIQKSNVDAAIATRNHAAARSTQTRQRKTGNSNDGGIS